MYSGLLPIFLIILGQFILPTWSQPTLVPPSTFPTVLPFSTATGSASSNSSTTTGASGSLSASSSATPTSSAQFPSLSGVPSCVSNCLESAISRVNCSSVVDVNCFCVSNLFPSELVGCIEASCPDQLDAAENLAQKFCGVASQSTSLSFASVPTTILSSTSGSVSTSSATAPPTSAASTTPSSAATWNTQGVGKMTLFGLTISALGVVLGAYAIL